jgi:hypothetical protein
MIMTGDVPHADLTTLNYIRSADAYSSAKTKGFLELLKGWIKKKDCIALSFHQIVGELKSVETTYLGLKNIPTSQILGSFGRVGEFTQSFYPLARSARQKERWRVSYTKTITGFGYPPIEAYLYQNIYFVVNGHHRVSISKFLGWDTIEAHVSEICKPRI